MTDSVITESSLRRALLPYRPYDARYDIEHRRLVRMLDAQGNLTVFGGITSASPFVLGPDASNKVTFAVDAAGFLTITATGTSAGIRLFPEDSAFAIRRAASPQERIEYDASNYLDVSVASNGAVTLTPVGAGAKITSAQNINVGSGKVYEVNGTQVVSAQGSAVADASGGATVDAEARTAINTLLARLRTHGLIAT